jgi:hypothetical protein
MDALLRAIARNAAALLSDAKFLFEHRRYPRAAALAYCCRLVLHHRADLFQIGVVSRQF